MFMDIVCAYQMELTDFYAEMHETIGIRKQFLYCAINLA